MEHNLSESFQDVQLLPMDAAGSEWYRKLRNKEEKSRWFICSSRITQEEQKKWFEKYLLTEGEYMFSIMDRENNYIGGCGIYNQNQKTAEFGRIIIEPEGMGYGYQATMAIIKIAADKLGLRELILTVKKDNLPARRIYEKAGFEYELDLTKKEDRCRMKCLLYGGK